VKPLKITAARLRRWGMCKEGVDQFRREFPGGVTFTSAIRPQWPEELDKIGWSAVVHVLSPEWLRRYQVAVRVARNEYQRVRRHALVTSLCLMDARGELPR
jgi:hypothetical protein